jgi:hypothetical protein
VSGAQHSLKKCIKEHSVTLFLEKTEGDTNKMKAVWVNPTRKTRHKRKSLAGATTGGKKPGRKDEDGDEDSGDDDDSEESDIGSQTKAEIVDLDDNADEAKQDEVKHESDTDEGVVEGEDKAPTQDPVNDRDGEEGELEIPTRPRLKKRTFM